MAPPISWAPHWDDRDSPPAGTFASGAEAGNAGCAPPCAGSPGLPLGWFVYDLTHLSERMAWYGTIIDAKRDAAGTHYRRSRAYDPATGRFTQEDPIGLAGGVNLYGFANGDPANFSDPFGLCPTCENDAMLQIQVEGVEKRTGRDVVVLAGAGLAAAAGGVAIAAGTSAITATAGAACAVMCKPGTPPFEGFTNWGRNVVQWGSTAKGALERAANFTVEQAAKLDPNQVRTARDWYKLSGEAGRGGAAAPARAQLMQRILDLQRVRDYYQP